MRLKAGDSAPRFEAEAVAGEPVVVHAGHARHVLLGFLRYASCPMCLLRLDELVRHAGELQAAGIDVVVVLHSSRERILRHARRALPFRVIADPGRRLYRLYGVEASWSRLFLSTVLPSFYRRWAAATVRGYLGGMIDGEFARMPGDFLIAPGGRIVRAHYGRHIGDHMELQGVARLACLRT